VGQQLDYLNKELVRFKEERRIHAMVMLAERQRSMREAEEKGKREEEEKRRATQDEMYRQIMQVHQGTVDSFLETILSQSVENTSRKQAMIEVCMCALRLPL
jgi:predicted phage gp36 major capsid-like protein